MKHLRRDIKEAIFWSLDCSLKFVGHYHVDIYESYVSG